MSLVNMIRGCCGVCWFIYYFIIKDLFYPVLYLMRVVDADTGQPLRGVQLELKGYDERMLLPGYPKIVGTTNPRGVMGGRLSTASLGFTPTYHLILGDLRMWVEPEGRRALIGFGWLSQRLRQPQLVNLNRGHSSYGVRH